MIIIAASLENISSRKDHTWKLVFGTQELTPDQITEVSRASNQFVFLAIKKDEFKTEEKEIVADLKSDYEDKGKSPAQRIRSVLYILFKQDPEGFTTFDDFYRNKTEKYIEHLKGKIL